VNATDLTGTDDFSDVFTVVYDEETSNYYILVDQDAATSPRHRSRMATSSRPSSRFRMSSSCAADGDSFDDGEELEDAYETANATFSVEEAGSRPERRERRR